MTSRSRILVGLLLIALAVAVGRWVRAPKSGEPLAYTECPFRSPARVTLLPGMAPEDTLPVRRHEEAHAAQCESLGPWRYRMRNLTSRGRLSLEAPGYCAGAAARIQQGQDSARVRERLQDDAVAAFHGRLDSTVVLEALRTNCPRIAGV